MDKRIKLTILAGSIATAMSLSPIVTHAQTLSAKADLVSLKNFDDKNEQKIVFEFAGGKPSVRSFQLSNPKRIVLDFAGATNRSQTGGVSYQGTAIQTIDLAGDETRLRAVISLYDDSTLSESWNGSQYVLAFTRKSVKSKIPATDVKLPSPAQAKTVEEAKAVAANEQTAPTTQQNIAEVKPAAQTSQNQNTDRLAQEILKLDFKKGKTPGSGRLLIDLTNADTPIDIKSTKGGYIIDFMNTTTPANLVRKFDVADQMTPVSSMEFKQMPDRTRLLVRAQGKWEQAAYQLENRFIFEVKPVFNDTMTKESAEGKIFKGDKLTLNFQNVEVRTILQVLSDFSGLNIITSDTVGGNLTLRLKEVPWDQALDLILQAKNLDKRAQGNVMWVAPQAEIRLKDNEDAKFRTEQSLNQPLITESFEINYAKAADVKAILGDQKIGVLSARGSAVVDPRTNTLFVQDIADRILAAKSMIKKVDIPVKQVMIEARIVEATDSFGKSLGARLGFNQV